VRHGLCARRRKLPQLVAFTFVKLTIGLTKNMQHVGSCCRLLATLNLVASTCCFCMSLCTEWDVDASGFIYINGYLPLPNAIVHERLCRISPRYNPVLHPALGRMAIYRSISLTSRLCKVIKKVIVKYFSDYLYEGRSVIKFTKRRLFILK